MSFQFDASYYLNNNLDVRLAVELGQIASPLAHYNQFGWSEGRDPNANFDTSYYIAANPEVADAVRAGDFESPLQHFQLYGASEGRAPNEAAAELIALFDEAGYLAANPDVAAAIPGSFANGLEHYQLYGQFEDRPGVPVLPGDFELTTSADIFTGGDNNDVFNAPLNVGIDGLVAVQTLQGQDVLDGGGGDNTLVAELNGTGTTANPRLSNIQTLELTSVQGVVFGIGGPGELDLSRATGVEEVWNIDSRNDLNVLSVTAPVLIGLDGVRGGTEFYVEYDADVVFETQDVVANNVGSPGSGPVDLNIWMGNLEYFTTLNLEVSNGVYMVLGEDANWMENFNISGSGVLQLEGDDDFPRLVNLDSTQYTGDLDLDVSGSAVLESVATGDANDRVVVNNLAVDGNLSVDMGGGENTLAINNHGGGILNHNEISNLDFTGGVTNVQTLEFVDNVVFFNDGALDLDGFDVPPATIQFVGFDGNGNDFTISNAGPDLLLTASDEFEMDGGELTVDGVVHLTVESTGTGDSDVRLDNNVSGDVLESLTVNAADDAEVELNSPDELAALRDVSVSAVGDDAELRIYGNSGTAEVHGVRQVEQIVVDVSPSGFPTFTAAGTVVFNSSGLNDGLPSGVVSTSYSAGTFFTDADAAADIAADLDARPELSASTGLFSNVINVEWADFGPQSGLAVFSQNATSGSINSIAPSTVTDGVDPIAMVAGTGYESLETVSLDAADDATADLHDVYGHFTLTVTAGNEADVHLYNTEATSVSVTAGTFADVEIGGDTIGASSLTTVTVDANTADVTLGTGDTDSNGFAIGNDFSSFTTLDVSSVIENVNVDTSTADFQQAAGQFVTYNIGATQDGTNAIDVNFTSNEAREVFSFVGDDIGEVQVNDFTAGNDPVAGDRIDLSQFSNITSAGDLIFTDVAGDLVVTDLGGDDFGGSITLTGLAGQADDVASFNIIYA